MTFGEKLLKLRKESGYTQEQLADILSVSRQSISKWESDRAFPETEKLIELGKLFKCSMDYLLKEDVIEKNATQSSTINENIKEFSKKALSDENKHKIKKILKIVGIVFGIILAIDFISLLVAIILYLF